MFWTMFFDNVQNFWTKQMDRALDLLQPFDVTKEGRFQHSSLFFIAKNSRSAAVDSSFSDWLNSSFSIQSCPMIEVLAYTHSTSFSNYYEVSLWLRRRQNSGFFLAFLVQPDLLREKGYRQNNFIKRVFNKANIQYFANFLDCF